MPLASYLLTRVDDGLSLTLPQWGITAGQRTVKHARADELALGFTAYVDAVPTLRPGQQVRLFKDGTCRFAGRVQTTTARGAGTIESQSATCVGPWQDLEDLTYQMPVVVIPNPSTAQPILPNSLLGGISLVGTSDEQTARVTANAAAAIRIESWPTQATQTPWVTIGASKVGLTDAVGCITAVLEYAATQGIVLDADTSQIGGGWSIPPEDISSVSCAEVIRRVMKWRPDITIWIDYSGVPVHPPKLVFSDRAIATPIALNTADGTIEDLDFTLRADLQVDGVDIAFRRVLAVGEANFSALEKDTAGSTTSLRTLHLAFNFGDITRDPATQAQTGDSIPTGLATKLYTALSVPQWEGQVRLVDQDASLADWIGHPLNVTGAAPIDWQTMRALVTTAVENLQSGRTTLTIGPPELKDLGTLRRQVRDTSPTTGDRINRNNTGVSSTPSDYPSEPVSVPGPSGVPDLPGQPGTGGPGDPNGNFQWGEPLAGDEDIAIGDLGTVYEFSGSTPLDIYATGSTIPTPDPAQPTYLAPLTVGPSLSSVPLKHEIYSWEAVGPGGIGYLWDRRRGGARVIRRMQMDLRGYRPSKYKKIVLVIEAYDNTTGGLISRGTLDISSYMGKIVPGFSLPAPPKVVHSFSTSTLMTCSTLRTYLRPA